PPGPVDRGRDHPRVRRRPGQVGRDQPALPVGDHRPLLHVEPDPPGARHDARADRSLHGNRDRDRNRAGGHASLAESATGGVELAQTEAAQSLGMTRLQTMRRIVLPQAMRVIVPPTGNETISMLKTTSLVSVIAVTDLLYSAQLIYAVNYRTIPLLIVASIWYLIVTTLLSFGQYYLERYFGRGTARELPQTPLQRL